MKQIGCKTSNCRPPHCSDQKKADVGEIQENNFSASSQDDNRQQSNGLVDPMEREKEYEDQQDTKERTSGIVNGDIGNRNTGPEDEGSSPQGDRTGKESHTGNEDATETESVHRQSEGVADQKVCAHQLCT